MPKTGQKMTGSDGRLSAGAEQNRVPPGSARFSTGPDASPPGREKDGYGAFHIFHRVFHPKALILPQKRP